MDSKYSAQRVAGREHFPNFPKGFIAIRILQLVLSLICLALNAFGIAYIVFAGDCLMIFTAICTVIISIYYIVAEFGAPRMYNYWAVLALDIFLLLFWLISFALLAAGVAPYMAGPFCVDGYCYDGLSSGEMIIASCLAAAAGIGGLLFILYIISLSITGVMIHRHRRAGLHCTPGSGGEKVQMQSQPSNAQYQQQHNYTQPAQNAPGQQGYAAPQPQYPQQVPSPNSNHGPYQQPHPEMTDYAQQPHGYQQ